MPRGGYQAPSNPAPVSGPGSLSRRTDGRPQPVADMPDAQYGENADFTSIQSGAPMAGGTPAATPPAGAGGGQPPTPFDAPTARPGEPVTAGADAGPGPGSSALGMSLDGMQRGELRALKQYLPLIEAMGKRADTPESVRRLARYLRGIT